MIPKLESAVCVGGYVIHIKFTDGTEGNVDLRDELWGEVFEPLKSPELFQSFVLDKELNTITWPTGADLAPEFLYERASLDANTIGRTADRR
jgi:hypothetical protein